MSADAILLAIGAKEGHLEGLFAPDTYHFHAGVSDLQVLKAAYDRQQEILTEEWTNRGTNCAVKSPYEALILASIVEREVARSEDRLIVAGIFSNRLRIKMPLQTDPSVIYGEGEDFEGRLRRKHLDRDTPYNTYRFVGLPPTPIGNPTRASIHAVMHPAKTPYLYFINKENGDLVASRTLQEHNRAVNRYIRKNASPDSKTYHLDPPARTKEIIIGVTVAAAVCVVVSIASFAKKPNKENKKPSKDNKEKPESAEAPKASKGSSGSKPKAKKM